MCGIAGLISRAPVAANKIAACVEALRHRGPDFQGHRSMAFADRFLTLVHARLSIIDLDPRANQPFSRHGKHLVFNGEIYNYREVRARLERIGRRFDTESDTEVLIEALDAWGWDALDQLEGMWAFALFDEAEQAVYLCRDRFGEKPLFVRRHSDGSVAFGSEIAALSALVDERFKIDQQHLLRYLVNGYRSLCKEKPNFFLDVDQCPAATVMRIDAAGRFQSWRYWFPRFDQNPDMGFDEAVAGVRERLIRSVELRLCADVPIAFCMSGGVDSNALISIGKRVLGYDVHGFTILNVDTRYEEADLVDAAVADLGIKHTSIRPETGEFLDSLQQMVKARSAPVVTISYYVQWLLYRAVAEQGYKVAISGTAADELFSGYYDHQGLYLQAVHSDPARFDSALAEWQTHIAPIVRNPVLQDPYVFIKNPFERGHIYLDADEFSTLLRKPWQEPFRETFYARDLLRNRMANELFEEVTPVILHEDDHNAMMHSIENRSPFLDRDLFEFSCTIPTRHLVRDGMAKAPLREAMRGIAPAPVLDSRRKVGFNAPILELANVKDAAVRKWLLGDSPIFDLLRRDAIEDLIGNEHLPNSRSKFLFYFISAKMFLEEFA